MNLVSDKACKRIFQKKRGFTLIELMVTIAIAGILLFVGIPSLTDFIAASRASQQASYVSSTLQMARVNAIESGQMVGVCPATPELTGCAKGWNQAIMVFIDADDNGTYDSGETVLHSVEAAPSSINRSYNNGNMIMYQPEGYTNNFGSFTICDSSKKDEYARSVTINRQGRIKPSKDSNGDGIHEDSGGTALSCGG